MIGKISKGNCFRGAVNYVLGKKEVKLIDAEGVFTDSANSIIRSFVAQTQLNERIKQPVEHIVLAYKKEDASMLTDAKMIELAKEYMELMELTNTQYIIVRHSDREHPHCHIILNRIDNDGKLISDKHDKLRNMTVCKYLKQKHGLTFGENKANVDLNMLPPKGKAKHEIYHIVTASLKKSRSFDDLSKALKKHGVTMEYIYQGDTKIIKGIGFEKDGFRFKGSQIDRNYSYSKLCGYFERAHRNQIVQKPTVTPIYEQPKQQSDDTLIGSLLGAISLKSDYTEDPEEIQALIEARKKKKKKKQRIKL